VSAGKSRKFFCVPIWDAHYIPIVQSPELRRVRLRASQTSQNRKTQVETTYDDKNPLAQYILSGKNPLAQYILSGLPRYLLTARFIY